MLHDKYSRQSITNQRESHIRHKRYGNDCQRYRNTSNNFHDPRSPTWISTSSDNNTQQRHEDHAHIVANGSRLRPSDCSPLASSLAAAEPAWLRNDCWAGTQLHLTFNMLINSQANRYTGTGLMNDDVCSIRSLKGPWSYYGVFMALFCISNKGPPRRPTINTVASTFQNIVCLLNHREETVF